MNDEMGKILNSHTVRLERVFPGPIERVFDYLSKPELLATWLMPAMVEPQVGGRIRFRSEPIPENVIGPTDSQPSECSIRGVITHYDPPRIISYSWNESNYGVATEVRFELEQKGNDVHLVVTHSRLPGNFMAAVAAGWHTHLETLLALVTGQPVEEFFSRFNPRLEEYKVMVAAAGIAVTLAAGNQAMASNDSAHDAVKNARAIVLTKYDQTWKNIDNLKYKIEQLEKTKSPDVDRALDDLYSDLKKSTQDLDQLELNLRDLDKAIL